MARYSRIGLIANPCAGQGGRQVAQAIRGAVAALDPDDIYTGLAELDAGSLDDTGQLRPSPFRTHVVRTASATGRAATRELARAVCGMALDAVVVVGGDGTVADVATELIAASCPTPLVGVGAGTANAGSLITCLASDVAGLATAELAAGAVDALLARVRDEAAAAFNDVTIGHGIVGTDSTGEMATYSAARFLAGERVLATAQPIDSPVAQVRLDHTAGSVLLAAANQVGSVAVGILDGRFVAKAAAGGTCLADLSGAPAACCVADVALVRGRLTSAERYRPVHSVSIPVFADNTITVCGVDAVLCADGNPVCVLDVQTVTTVTVRPRAVTAVRLRRPPVGAPR
jgi:hypothetical protein